MLNFEYQIKLNDEGRPYIDIPDTYQDSPEDKFMALEIARYIFIQVLQTSESTIDEGSKEALTTTIDTLEKVSDEVAVLIKEQMTLMGESSLIMKRDYHIQVDSIEERDNLNYEGIIYNGKIFKRNIGLKVLVLNNMRIYELKDGIDNENWIEL